MKRKGVFLLVLIFLSGCGNTTADTIKEKNSLSEESLHQTTADYIKAFNSHDPDKILKFWDPQATYINPVKNLELHGHKEIKNEFKKLFDKKANKLEIFLKTIEFPDPGKAIETGRYKITFSSDLPPSENAFRAEMIYNGSEWLYKNVRQISLETISPKETHLKKLEWLVGDWIDQDEDVDIETKTNWEYQNFIVQHFSMKLYGQEALEGEQIIGWDPSTQRFRSWVFDSDGGIGEGDWEERDGKWYVKMRYALSNGDRASSVQIYRPLPDGSYTWASEGRDVNGEILPSISPIKIVKKSRKGTDKKE